MRGRKLFWKCIWRLGILENNEHLMKSVNVIIHIKKIEQVRAIVKACKECQLVKQTGSIRSNVENLKNIPICDQFYKVALVTTIPLPNTNKGNKYIFVAIDHYSKWCETKAIPNHTIATATRFLEKYIIYKYGMPNFILTDNGGEWSVEFDNLHKVYNIHHQYTMP